MDLIGQRGIAGAREDGAQRVLHRLSCREPRGEEGDHGSIGEWGSAPLDHQGAQPSQLGLLRGLEDPRRPRASSRGAKKDVAAAYPVGDVYVVWDNLNIHIGEAWERFNVTRSLCDAAYELSQQARVQRHHGTLRGARVGQDEARAMKALVEEAVAVVVEPQQLHPVAALAGEHEQSSALGVQRQPLSNSERETIKGAAHVLAHGAYEDPNLGGDHRRRSST